jgi:two-component system, OmpR family, sensor histidine kinase KdpD
VPIGWSGKAVIGRVFSLARVVVSVCVVAAVTALYAAAVHVNPTTVALTYVVVILLVATAWGITEATIASLVATVCFNLFFLPPVGTLTIADPQNWIALAAFLLTAIVASQLSGRARSRTLEAVGRQRDLERLYALSRALLLSADRPSIRTTIARHIADAFGLETVAVYDHHADTVSWAGSTEIPWIEKTLRDVARQGAAFRDASGMRVIGIQLGGAPIGALALVDEGLSDTVVQSIANLAAIGLERARGHEATARAEAARQSGELRAVTLDALAHDFKTPLTSMKAAAGDLRSNVTDGRNRELATIIDEEVDRLQALVSDAVQMLRIDAGDFVLHRDRHTLADIVGWTLRQFESRLDGHLVTTHIPASLSVDADRDLLGLALRQLLDNAVKYSPPASTIEIDAAGGRTVEIVVRNSGPAIPERERDRVFERFYRGSQARRIPGTGIGLTIVQQIAQAHGGTVSMASSPERGTQVTISLPSGEATS